MVIREELCLSLSLCFSLSLADSTYLSLSLLLLGDPFLGNVLAGAGAASSRCIPPAKQAPQASCSPSFPCLQPRLLLLPCPTTTLRDRDSALGLICGSLLQPGGRDLEAASNLCITICITLKFTLFFGLGGAFPPHPRFPPSRRNLAAGNGIASSLAPLLA